VKSEDKALEKSQNFAIRIIRLYKYLNESKKEYVIAKQLLRSGTSVGANIVEAKCAISKKDFLAKIYVALKECSETKYWLMLLYKTDYINKKEFESVVSDCEDIRRILSATTRTIRGK